MNVLMLSLEHPHEPKSGLGVHLNRLISYLKLHKHYSLYSKQAAVFICAV